MLGHFGGSLRLLYQALFTTELKLEDPGSELCAGQARKHILARGAKRPPY